MSDFNLAALLRKANRIVAIGVGSVLLLTAIFVVVDILLRQLGHSVGGSDEISGYVMACAGSWGLSFGLTELAHVRIDAIRQLTSSGGRRVFDFIALTALSAVACFVAYRGWDVLAKSFRTGATANTVLETAMWIPQSIWLAGWIWFAVCAVGLLVSAFLTLAGRTSGNSEPYGLRPEIEEAV